MIGVCDLSHDKSEEILQDSRENLRASEWIESLSLGRFLMMATSWQRGSEFPGKDPYHREEDSLRVKRIEETIIESERRERC